MSKSIVQEFYENLYKQLESDEPIVLEPLHDGVEPIVVWPKPTGTKLN